MYLDTNGLYFSGMEIKVAEGIVKLDNARIFILVTGLIIIVGFSIFTASLMGIFGTLIYIRGRKTGVYK
jgi:hypothetical protein